MNILTKFELVIIASIAVGVTNAENQNSTERYNAIVNKSTYNVGKCIEIVNKLEVLKSEIVMLLKRVNIDATNINNTDNTQSTEEIIKNIATICKLLQKTVDEKDNNESEEDAIKISKEMSSNDGDIIGRYETITKILVSLHERLYKLIAKFNVLQRNVEDTMAEITYDLRNINSTMNAKEDAVKDSTDHLTQLKLDVKELVKSLEKGIDECKKHFDNIKNINKNHKKQQTDEKESDTNDKKTSEKQEKDEKKENSQENKDDVKGDGEKENNNLDKKESESNGGKSDDKKLDTKKNEDVKVKVNENATDKQNTASDKKEENNVNENKYKNN